MHEYLWLVFHEILWHSLDLHASQYEATVEVTNRRTQYNTALEKRKNEWRSVIERNGDHSPTSTTFLQQLQLFLCRTVQTCPHSHDSQWSEERAIQNQSEDNRAMCWRLAANGDLCLKASVSISPLRLHLTQDPPMAHPELTSHRSISSNLCFTIPKTIETRTSVTQ